MTQSWAVVSSAESCRRGYAFIVSLPGYSGSKRGPGLHVLVPSAPLNIMGLHDLGFVVL